MVWIRLLLSQRILRRRVGNSEHALPGRALGRGWSFPECAAARWTRSDATCEDGGSDRPVVQSTGIVTGIPPVPASSVYVIDSSSVPVGTSAYSTAVASIPAGICGPEVEKEP